MFVAAAEEKWVARAALDEAARASFVEEAAACAGAEK